jgi:hypothetical protein
VTNARGALTLAGEISVSLRFFGDDIDPQLISELLGTRPSNAYRKGDPAPHHAGRSRFTGVWALDSQLPSNEALEAHVSSLLSTVGKNLSQIRSLTDAGFRGDILVTYGARDPGQEGLHGVDLGAPTMRQLADLGLSLTVGIILDGGDEADAPGSKRADSW